jgi:MurNAc alpha-1-phosphate uridylyltransferase
MKPLLKSAFVLAAGRGERLRPYTDKTPKPLLAVKGKPLLDYVLENLKPLQLERVVLNAWHLKEQVVEYAKSRRNTFGFEILVSEENDLLGTGGGLKKAWPLLSGAPFLMANGDCLWSGDVQAFSESALKNGDAEGCWWLAPSQPDQTKIGVHHDRVHKIGNIWKEIQASSTATLPEYCFSGIQIFRELDFKVLPEQGSIVQDYWIKRLSAGAHLAAESKFLKTWVDIGTPQRYEAIK